jgi:hypothetical protein
MVNSGILLHNICTALTAESRESMSTFGALATAPIRSKSSLTRPSSLERLFGERAIAWQVMSRSRMMSCRSPLWPSRSLESPDPCVKAVIRAPGFQDSRPLILDPRVLSFGVSAYGFEALWFCFSCSSPNFNETPPGSANPGKGLHIPLSASQTCMANRRAASQRYPPPPPPPPPPPHSFPFWTS